MTAGEKAERLGRLAEAFEVCGKIGPDAPMLVLRASEPTVLAGSSEEAAVVDDLVATLRSIFAGPVVVVPFDWTQAQINAEAVRLAVAAEREACAKTLESEYPTRADGIETTADLVDWFQAKIRARGSK